MGHDSLNTLLILLTLWFTSVPCDLSEFNGSLIRIDAIRLPDLLTLIGTLPFNGSFTFSGTHTYS